jgi:hypothetical protein
VAVSVTLPTKKNYSISFEILICNVIKEPFEDDEDFANDCTLIYGTKGKNNYQ